MARKQHNKLVLRNCYTIIQVPQLITDRTLQTPLLATAGYSRSCYSNTNQGCSLAPGVCSLAPGLQPGCSCRSVTHPKCNSVHMLAHTLLHCAEPWNSAAHPVCFPVTCSTADTLVVVRCTQTTTSSVYSAVQANANSSTHSLLHTPSIEALPQQQHHAQQQSNSRRCSAIHQP